MSNKIYKISLLLATTISVPFIAGAAVLGKTEAILVKAKFIVTDILTPLVFVLALLVFFWGIVKYIWSEGSGKDEGKKIMIWGVVALFVMSSIWGIIYFLRDELDIEDDSAGRIPTLEN